MTYRASLATFALVPAALSAALATPGRASQTSDVAASYCTNLSVTDQQNSNGQPLTDAAAILRQDRANFHAFNMRDYGDQIDPLFVSADARARIPEMLAASQTAPEVLQAIVTGNPDVCVEVSGGRMTVTLNAAGNAASFIPSDRYPFEGRWDCEVGVFTFSASSYDTGSETLPYREVLEGTDGSYTLFFDEDYLITLSGFTPTAMGWFSHASQDSFQCRRLGAVSP